MSNISSIESLTTLNSYLLTEPASLHILVFRTEWDEASAAGGPCDKLLSTLASKHPTVRFGRVDAESEGGMQVADQFSVSAVPFFAFVRSKAVVDRVEGFDALSVTQKCEKWSKVGAGAAPGPASNDAVVPPALVELQSELDRLINASPVMAFIKGSPDQPRCKFSRMLLEVLAEEKVLFGSFDILSNEAVRQGLKEKVNWPTFPMLFCDGKLIGGIDIVKDMKESGDLAGIWPPSALSLQPPASSAAAGSDTSSSASAGELKALLASEGVMVFIKGPRTAPACGWSEMMLDLLTNSRVKFTATDVLANPRVRSGLKEVFNFTTYPQVFVRGERIGDVDTLKEIINKEGVGVGGLAAHLNVATSEDLKSKLTRLTSQKKIVLFMKGSPDAPRCGFSSRAVGELKKCNVDVSPSSKDFASVDILEHEDVRTGMKEFSQWPTFPQLYINGSFVGGLDIMNEMAQEGDLQALIGVAIGS